MKTILQRTERIEPSQSRTNVIIPFEVPEGFLGLFIQCSYSPKYIEDMEFAEREIKKGIAKYVPADAMEEYGSWHDYLPLCNLITLSLDCNGEYVGCAHRHDPLQKHIISLGYSSPGFDRHAAKGSWRAVINVHCVTGNAPAFYELNIYGIEGGDEVDDRI